MIRLQQGKEGRNDTNEVQERFLGDKSPLLVGFISLIITAQNQKKQISKKKK